MYDAQYRTLQTDIDNALQYLSEHFNISVHYLAEPHARVPGVLNLRYKRAYREAGLSDQNNLLTDFGRAVFKHLDDEHAKTGKPVPRYLPQVGSFDR
ncbi:MAG: hypothetical protein ACLFR0_07975 [Alphaproteobacteria bacterium]